MYTSACDMKSPTVIPIVTAIIALPMSTPLPSAVMPPACDRPDYKTFIISKPQKIPDKRAPTGTRNSTPVTILVNAVPPIFLE